jgi:predicted aspartyl protease
MLRDVVNSEDDTGCDGLTVIDKDAYDKLYDAWCKVPQ